MKKKRGKRRIKHRAVPHPQTSLRVTTTVSPVPKRMAVTSSAESDILNTQRDKYRYVLGDLRWIGVIAGSLFLTLIVLKLILG